MLSVKVTDPPTLAPKSWTTWVAVFRIGAGRCTVPALVQVAPPSADRWTVKPVSFGELSVKVRVTTGLPLTLLATGGSPIDGLMGAMPMSIGRIMSFSS